MKCPYCQHLENKVIDSRLSKDGDVIRRRRHCLECERRFTTYERIEDILPMVIKKDGRREAYDRAKIIGGLKKAFEKRAVSIDVIEDMANRLERYFQDRGEKEIKSSEIGEWIMKELRDLDDVAYVRFASVYRSFKDIGQFMDELEELLRKRENGGKQPKDIDG